MKVKNWTTLAVVATFAVVASTGLAQTDGIVEFVAPGEDTIEDLELIKTLKDIGFALLTWVVGPLIGAFTAFKGWQMIGNAQRDEKGPGVLVLICGIGMFAIGKILTEALKAMGG